MGQSTQLSCHWNQALIWVRSSLTIASPLVILAGTGSDLPPHSSEHCCRSGAVKCSDDDFRITGHRYHSLWRGAGSLAVGSGAPDPASSLRAGGGRRGEPGALADLWRFGRNTSAGPGVVKGAGGGGGGSKGGGGGGGEDAGVAAAAGAGSGEGAAERTRRSFAIFYFTW